MIPMVPDRQRAVVRCAVHATGKAGDDHNAILAEVVRQPASEAAGRRRGVARAHDRHRLAVDQVEIAFRNQQRRRILDFGKKPGIKALSEREEPRAEPLHLRDLTLGVVAGPDRRRPPATPAGEVGHRSKSCGRRSEARDQLAVGDGADARRAQQPQAVGEIFDPIRGSVPFFRRRIFSRCFHRTSTAKPSNSRT